MSFMSHPNTAKTTLVVKQKNRHIRFGFQICELCLEVISVIIITSYKITPDFAKFDEYQFRCRCHRTGLPDL